MTSHARSLAVATLIVVALLVAACSGDGAATTAPSATTGATGSAPTTAPSPGSGDETTTSAAAPGDPPAITTTAGDPGTTAPTSGSSTTTTTTTMPVTPVPLADLDLALVEVATGFGPPVFVDAPAGDPRLFVVDLSGTITVLDGAARGIFLDLSDRVRFDNEQGLLGLAFHPDYAANGRLFVHYTRRDGSSVLDEHAVAAGDPNRADPAPVRTLLTVPQPAANHNGGMIAFGPDGYLYLALGDGGGANDRFGNGQNPDSLLGAILRLDVDQDPYGIPPDNVFAGGGGAPEIWAYGLRNPWRFSFDGDQIYIGDVGQGAWEEIDVASARSIGLNFGWPILEGNHCFDGPCDAPGLIPPAYEYDHSDGACSVTGGYVYRGAAIPELAGAYFFGDYCSGRITSFRIDGEGIFEIRDWTEGLGRVAGLTSFGTDGSGEIYLTSSLGSVYRIERG